MLYIIGIGMDEEDLTLKAINLLKESEKIYVEFYTNIWQGSIENLEKIIGKKINELPRERVESKFLIEEAGKSNIALLVPGDPLSATTHYELVALAKQEGIKYHIVHAPSIYTAIAKTGLQLYKFGRSTTLPRPQKGFDPSSPYDVIVSNQKLGYHTLVLLDIGMTISEGIGSLKRLDNEKILNKVIVCTKLGSKNEKIFYDSMDEIEKKNMEDVPAVIIVPGKMNFKEEEFLQNM